MGGPNCTQETHFHSENPQYLVKSLLLHTVQVISARADAKKGTTKVSGRKKKRKGRGLWLTKGGKEGLTVRLPHNASCTVSAASSTYHDKNEKMNCGYQTILNIFARY